MPLCVVWYLTCVIISIYIILPRCHCLTLQSKVSNPLQVSICQNNDWFFIYMYKAYFPFLCLFLSYKSGFHTHFKHKAISNFKVPGLLWFLCPVGAFCGRWTSWKFEEGTPSQLLVLLSAKRRPMYNLTVGICENGYPFPNNY